MGILKRLSRVTRASLTELKQRTLARSGKSVQELSDRELEEELLSRRRARAKGRSAPGPTQGPGLRPDPRQVQQWYANLELRRGATLDDVKRAYKSLMQRYHPDKHSGDDEKHRAATELAQSLTEAYRGLVEHLTKKH